MKFEDWINDDGQHCWKELSLTVKKLFPWTAYVVEIDEWRIMIPFGPDIKSWCEQNLIGRYDVSTISYFELEEDSVLFVLRWA